MSTTITQQVLADLDDNQATQLKILIERGIKPATAVEFGVGFYAGPGLLSGRIVIPIGNACSFRL